MPCAWSQSQRPADLYVSAVVASGRQLDAAEGDRTLQRHTDGRLLNAVLAVQAWRARNGTTAEVPLDCETGRGEGGHGGGGMLLEAQSRGSC